MGFKFKEVVEESIIYFYDHVLSSNEYTEDVFKELDHVYTQAPKANEYEAKNKELLEELKYLKKVNDDLVWQRDTDEEHEAKSAAFDESLEGFKELERLHEEVRKVSKRNREKSDVYKEVLSHVIREMESNLGESGESDD